MEHVGKLLLLAGLGLGLLGLAVWGLGKLGFRGLPGDIRHESESFTFYFPVVTCLAASLALTLLFWLLRWLRK